MGKGEKIQEARLPNIGKVKREKKNQKTIHSEPSSQKKGGGINACQHPH